MLYSPTPTCGITVRMVDDLEGLCDVDVSKAIAEYGVRRSVFSECLRPASRSLLHIGKRRERVRLAGDVLSESSQSRQLSPVSERCGVAALVSMRCHASRTLCSQPRSPGRLV